LEISKKKASGVIGSIITIMIVICEFIKPMVTP